MDCSAEIQNTCTNTKSAFVFEVLESDNIDEETGGQTDGGTEGGTDGEPVTEPDDSGAEKTLLQFFIFITMLYLL